MAKRGPAPKTKKELERAGSRRAKYRPDELQASGLAPKPPTGLDKEAKAEWARVVKLLGPQGVLAEADRAALTMYCELWSEDREFAKELKKMHPKYTVDWKRIFTARQDVRRKLMDMIARFGLSPADRPRVKVTTKKTTPNGKSKYFETQGKAKAPKLAG